ncbi:MAG: TRAP transporter small permease [Thermoleophilia bacterium]|nr:TRAP transporter small permease [Thermoleophilia bacterium]
MRSLAKAGRAFDWFIDAMLFVAGVIVFVQTVWITQDVIIRKAFDWTWAPSFEILTYSILWMTFLGTTAIYRDRGHVVMEAIVARFPARAADIINLVTTFAIAGLTAFLLYYSAKLTIQDYQSHFVLATILKPVKWPIEIVIPVAFLTLFIQSIRHMVTYYRAFKAGEYVKAGEKSSL